MKPEPGVIPVLVLSLEDLLRLFRIAVLIGRIVAILCLAGQRYARLKVPDGGICPSLM